jgi:hypothetical protein
MFNLIWIALVATGLESSAFHDFDRWANGLANLVCMSIPVWCMHAEVVLQANFAGILDLRIATTLYATRTSPWQPISPLQTEAFSLDWVAGAIAAKRDLTIPYGSPTRQKSPQLWCDALTAPASPFVGLGVDPAGFSSLTVAQSTTA